MGAIVVPFERGECQGRESYGSWAPTVSRTRASTSRATSFFFRQAYAGIIAHSHPAVRVRSCGQQPGPAAPGPTQRPGEGSLPSDEAFGKASRAPLRIRKSQHFVRTSLSKPKGISLISERRVSHQLHSFITASSRGTCSCAPTWPSLEPSPSARHRASSLTRRQ